MMRFALTLGTLGLLAGCVDVAPTTRAPIDNGNVAVGVLFHYEGCTVLRFEDAGHYHYFATCPGIVTTQQHQGKTSYPDEIPTVTP